MKEKNKHGYIYITENLINRKRYIGLHRSKEFEPNNYLGSGVDFLRDLKKYGKQNFKCKLIEWCSSEDKLTKQEQYWIAYYNAVEDPMFYNLSSGGGSGSFGTKRSKESIIKQSLATKGKKCPNKKWDENHKQKYINSRSFEVSEETKMKQSKALEGRSFTKEHCYNIKISKQNISEITREKMSQSRKGKKYNRKNTYNNLDTLILCLETGEVFKSAKEAETYLNGRYSGNINFSIRNNCKAYGYYWKRLSKEEYSNYLKEN